MDDDAFDDLDLAYDAPILPQDDALDEAGSPDVDLEYQAYMNSTGSIADAYFSPADFEDYGSESGESSDSKSRSNAPNAPDYGGIYGAFPLEQLEKEIDYLPIKDWQGELQALMKMDDCLEKWRGLARLGLDFQHAAGLYARVIVSECKLSENQKTIHTADIGGVAGGIKVICQGILFKIAIDKIGMYGSDANAAKAAGHEFKSSAAFFDLALPDVQIPLMAIIDYRGFRVTATSLLPISGRETLIYGSCDAGKTVQTTDLHFNDLMERAGTLLNLKPHYAGRDNPKLIYMPVDVEGHVTLRFKTKQPLSKSDSSPPPPTESPMAPGRRTYVVLDLARLFPPQLPAPHKKGSNHRPYLYELLRPEFVKTYPIPLSSDAFSPFNAVDPRAKEHNDEVAVACHHLKTVRIPQFASFIQKPSSLGLTPLNDLTCTAFVAALHSKGINLRFLGLVRRCLTHVYLRQVALTEMVSRVIKDQINEQLRSTTQTIQLPVEEPYRETVVNYLNRLFSADTADEFWRTHLRPAILKKFSLQSLDLDIDKKHHEAANPTPERLVDPLRISLTFNKTTEPNLRLFVDPLVMWSRVSELTGITLRKDSLKVMVGGFGITPSDIKDLKSRIRVTDLVNRALAIAISMDAKEKRGTESYRLYLRAHELFNDCVEVSAANADTYYHWGVMLQEMALHSYFNPKKLSLKLLKMGALPKLAQAVHINPGHLDANAALGWTLLEFLLHHQRFEAINLKTTNREALRDATRILERAAHHLVLSLGSVATDLTDSLDSVNPELSTTGASVAILPHLGLSGGDDNEGTSPGHSTLETSGGSGSSGATHPPKEKKKKKDKEKKHKTSNVITTPGHTSTTAALGKLNKKQVIENTVSREEYTERFEELAEQIELANASVFMALTYALWNTDRIRPLLAERGEVIGELDLVDASFLPKRGFILLPEVCPNLRVLRLRNAVFLDSKTASEMLRSPEAEEEDPPTEPVPKPPQLGSAAYNASGSSSGSSTKVRPNPIRFIKNKINAANGKNLTRHPSVTAGSMLSSLPYLRVLRFVCCEHMTDIEGFEKIVFPDLKILDFEKTGLSDAFFQSRMMARNLPSLADLIISGSQITDPSLNRLGVQFGSQLRSLELSACVNIQYVSCFNLMVSSPTLTSFKCLTHLDLSGCRSLAASAISHFVKSLAAPPAPAAKPPSSSSSSSASILTNLGSSTTALNTSVSSSISVASSGSQGSPTSTPPTGSDSIVSNSTNGQSSPHHARNPQFFQQHYHHNPSSSGDNIRQMSNPTPAPLPSTAPTSEREIAVGVSSVAALGISTATVSSVAKLPYTLHVPSLMFLNLDGCSSLTEDIWNSIPKKCPLLVSVSMEKATAGPSFFESLGANCQRLERLHAPACKNLEPASLVKVLQGCPNLTYLDASFWNWSPQELAPKLAKHWTPNNLPPTLALEQAYICAWPLEEARLSLLFSRCPSLKVVDLSNCHTAGPSIFSIFAKHCPKLYRITVNAITPSDAAVEILTNGCPQLRHASFLRATELTDSTLVSLSRCKQLTRLNLTHSPFITNEGIQLLITACPTLTRLGIKGSKLVTSEFMFDKLRHSCSELGIEMDSDKHVFLSFPL